LENIRLSLEEKETLIDIASRPSFSVVLRELEAVVQVVQQDVIKFDLSTGDERELIRRKCRAEGAAQLLVKFKQRLDNLKTKQKA
jgi:hypothetical protein